MGFKLLKLADLLSGLLGHMTYISLNYRSQKSFLVLVLQGVPQTLMLKVPRIY